VNLPGLFDDPAGIEPEVTDRDNILGKSDIHGTTSQTVEIS